MAKSRLLDKDGNLVILNGSYVFVQGKKEVEQQIEYRLTNVKGESIFDEESGTPYLEDILGKYKSIKIYEEAIRDRIKGTTGVERIIALESDYDRVSRKLSYTVIVETTEGDVVTIERAEEIKETLTQLQNEQ